MAYDAAYHADYYQKNKERKNAQSRRWAIENRDKDRLARRARAAVRRELFPEQVKEATLRWETSNPKKVMLKAARNRAKAKGWEFDIEVEDIVIPDTCPLLGIPLVSSRGTHGPKDHSPSLDRIDSDRGYVKGNVWVISNRANRIKTDATAEEILMVGQNLLKLNETPTCQSLLGRNKNGQSPNAD